MAELVDASDLKSGGHYARAGSTPVPATKLNKIIWKINKTNQ